MHILHIIGYCLIISLLVTGAALLVQIMKMEKEIMAEKNEKAGRSIDAEWGGDTAD